MTEFLASRLRACSPDARQDFATVVRVALRECPRRWTRTRGVQDLWVIVRAGGEVEVRRPVPRSLMGHRYADDIHTAGVFHADVDRQLGTNRCVALLYGNGWRATRLPFMSNVDDAVVINGKHRDGTRFDAMLHFTRVGRLFRRVDFDPAVVALVA